MNHERRSFLSVASFLLLLLLHPGAGNPIHAQPVSSPAEETGYFNGRLWRTGLPYPPLSSVTTDEQGNLIVAGTRLGVTGFRLADIARWDGRTWEVLATNAPGVEVMVTLGSNLYVGGFFKEVDGLVCNHVAHFDGTRWHALGPGLGGPQDFLQTLAVSGDRLYASSVLTHSSTGPINRVAQWDPDSDTWKPLGEGLPAIVRTLVAVGEILYAGVGDTVQRWDGTQWETFAQLAADPPRSPGVGALLGWDGDLYVAGEFQSVNGVAAQSVARWHGGQWEPVSEHPLPGFVNGLAFVQGRLWAAGRFHEPGVMGSAAVKMVALHADGWRVQPEFSGFNTFSLCGTGREAYVISAAAPRISQRPNELVVWQHDGSRWIPVNGGFSSDLNPPTQVACSRQEVVLWGFSVNLELYPYPFLHDGALFRTTVGDSNAANARLRIGSALVGSGEAVYASARWPDRLDDRLIARLEGEVWKAATPVVPLREINQLARAPGRLYAAGERTRTNGEIWEWDAVNWKRLGGPFDPPPVPTPAPPGRAAALFYSLAWHDGRIYAGCGAATMEGQIRSNLVVWTGSAWEQFLSLSGPATLLKSEKGRLYIGSHTNGKPSILVWDGESAEEVGSGLPLDTLLGFSVSQDGLLAAVGIPQTPTGIPLWFRRNGEWKPPENWRPIPAPESIRDCVWHGHDLYLVGISRLISNLESAGLAIWHEPGPRLVTGNDAASGPLLRATGAVPARFAWEHSDQLGGWVPFATNALGNPGWIAPPGSEAETRFFRIRSLP